MIDFSASPETAKRYWNFHFWRSRDRTSVYSEKPNALLMFLRPFLLFDSQFINQPLVLSGIYIDFFASPETVKRYWNFHFLQSRDSTLIYSEKPCGFLMILDARFAFGLKKHQ